LIYIYKQFLAWKKRIWYLYSGTISKFFPPPYNKDENHDAFPGNKPIATEIYGVRIKNRANIE
jgi:hypothetical protein